MHQLISQSTQYLDSWLSDLEVEGDRHVAHCPIVGDATACHADSENNATGFAAPSLLNTLLSLLLLLLLMMMMMVIVCKDDQAADACGL